MSDELSIFQIERELIDTLLVSTEENDIVWVDIDNRRGYYADVENGLRVEVRLGENHVSYEIDIWRYKDFLHTFNDARLKDKTRRLYDSARFQARDIRVVTNEIIEGLKEMRRKGEQGE